MIDTSCYVDRLTLSGAITGGDLDNHSISLEKSVETDTDHYHIVDSLPHCV